MQYSTVYIGMDVHKDSFSLCCYTNEKEKAEYSQFVLLFCSISRLPHTSQAPHSVPHLLLTLPAH